MGKKGLLRDDDSYYIADYILSNFSPLSFPHIYTGTLTCPLGKLIFLCDVWSVDVSDISLSDMQIKDKLRRE